MSNVITLTADCQTKVTVTDMITYFYRMDTNRTKIELEYSQN